AARRPATASPARIVWRVEITRRLYRGGTSTRGPRRASRAGRRGAAAAPRAGARGADRGLALLLAGLRLGADRVPDDERQVDDRDLQHEHHEDELPRLPGHLGIVRHR